MPKLSREEYTRMKQSPLKATRDAVDEMIASGTQVENLPRPEKPSLLGFVKDTAKRLLTPEAKAGEPDRSKSIGYRVGANMRAYSDLNRELSKPGGMNEAEHAEIHQRRFGSDEINEETIEAQKKKDAEAVRKRMKGGG